MPNYMELVDHVNGAARIADDAAFDPTGDIEIRFDLACLWATYPTNNTLLNRYSSAGDNRQFQLTYIASTDDLKWHLGTGTGTARTTTDWNAFSAIGLADLERVQLRIRLDADNGAGNTEVAFSYRLGANIADLANDDNWTVSETDTITGVQSWKAIAGGITLGNSDSLTLVFPGQYYRFIFWTDLTKTTKVADVDFTNDANIDVGATDDNTWNDAVSANDWVMQGTHETDWDYVRESAGGNLLLLGVG